MPGDPAREDPERRVARALRAHRLGEAGRLAVDHDARRLGRDVVGRHPGAARREDQVAAALDEVVQAVLDQRRSRPARPPSRRSRSRPPRRAPASTGPERSSLSRRRHGGRDGEDRGADGAEPRRSARGSARTSTLPPDRITPVRRPPPSTLPASSAASADAPLGSSTSLRRSNAKRIAATISASETVTTTRRRARGSRRRCARRACRAAGRRRSSGRPARARARPAASERRVSSPTSGSTPTTAAVRAQRGGRRRGARDQPAAADRDEQQVERAAVLDQLERRGALAGHDALVVVGVHDRQALALGATRRSAPRGRPSSGRSGRSARRSPRSRPPSTPARPRASGSSRGMSCSARRQRERLRVVARRRR